MAADGGKWNRGPIELAEKVAVEHSPRRPLIALPPEIGLAERLFPNAPDSVSFFLDYAVYRRERPSTPARAVFAASYELVGEPHDLAMVFLPRGRELGEALFRSLAPSVAAGAPVIVIGPKKSGIRSSRPAIEATLGPVEDSRAARHSVALIARRDVALLSPEPAPDSGAPDSEETRFSVDAFGFRFQVVTLPGVFSHGRLDTGTAYLLEHLPPPKFRRALDLGCGGGVLSAALGLLRPEAEVVSVDSQARALEATRRTLTAAGLTPRVAPSDVYSDVEGRFDLILTNPPFHSSFDTDFSITERIITEAPHHLTRGGRLVLVANRHINYYRYLRPTFRKVETLAESRHFRVLEGWV